MVTKKDVDFVLNVYKRCGHNPKLAGELQKALHMAQAWLQTSDAVRKIPFKELEPVLAAGNEWDRSAAFKGKPASLLEEAVPMVERWKKSSVLQKQSPQAIADALEYMGTWHGHPKFRQFSPGELADASDAFKGKSPSEFARGDFLEKAWKQSPKFRSKPRRDFDRAVELYSYWYNNKRVFRNATPAFLAGAERIAPEWRKLFGSKKADTLAQADVLVREWKGNSVLKTMTPKAIGAAVAVAQSWNKARVLKDAKPKDVAAALERILEIVRAPEASLFFDGYYLHWHQRGKHASWPAYSGKRGYWMGGNFSPEAQGTRKKGPTPEGTYAVRQEEFQIREDGLWEVSKQLVGKMRGKPGGRWKGNYHAWGDQRVALIPEKFVHSDIKRGEFSIHGGEVAGSAGCIDLTEYMPEFADRFRLYGRDMELIVSYTSDEVDGRIYVRMEAHKQ